MKHLISTAALLVASFPFFGSLALAQTPLVLENDCLKMSFWVCDSTKRPPEERGQGAIRSCGLHFDVLDRRTGRVWKQAEAGIQASGFQASKDFVSFDLNLPGQPKEYRATVRLDSGKPEFVVELTAPTETEIRSPVFYPPAFQPKPGDRIIVPIGEGISYPVEVSDSPLGIRPYYSGHGVTMAFFAVQEDRVLKSGESTGGSAYMAICETPDNSGIHLLRVAGDGSDNKPEPQTDFDKANSDGQLLTVRQAWGADRGKWGPGRGERENNGNRQTTNVRVSNVSPCPSGFGLRRVRFVFFDGGGHVAICKRYRQYAQERGLVVPFAEKIKRNPARKAKLGKLFGAANVWVLSGEFRSEFKNLYDEATGNYRKSPETQKFMNDQLAIYRDMRTHGMDHLLVGAGSDGAHVRQINEIDGALSSRYDIYQDVMDPAQYDNLTAIKKEWPKESYPQDLRVNCDGSLARGWQVPQKDPAKPMVGCNQLCDRQVVPYARKRIAEELKVKPYTCRFIDVTACSDWSECWSPAHPTTRSESREFKSKLLALPGEEFNLVLGSETGHEAFVPVCDYFEGMLSLIVCRVPDSGRNMAKIWNEVPANVAKYQVGESYRLPLFELVYHECVVSYWYWCDYNNKLPSLWGKRDLFNALYGTPPMYVVRPDNWPEFRERIFASYRVAEPVSKLTAQSEMTNHRILTADWAVQQTVFANGVRVTANFGAVDYSMSDGFVLKPGASRIEEGL